MSAIIQTKQTNLEGIEQFWFMKIKYCIAEFVPGKSYAYKLYAIYEAYNTKIYIDKYSSMQEVKGKIIELMHGNTIIVPKEE